METQCNLFGESAGISVESGTFPMENLPGPGPPELDARWRPGWLGQPAIQASSQGQRGKTLELRAAGIPQAQKAKNTWEKQNKQKNQSTSMEKAKKPWE